jgi:hypothetical protein
MPHRNTPSLSSLRMRSNPMCDRGAGPVPFVHSTGPDAAAEKRLAAGTQKPCSIYSMTGCRQQ